MAIVSDGRTGKTLRHKEDWKSLLSGEVDAIILEGFANSTESEELHRALVESPNLAQYEHAAGIHRLGTSLSNLRGKADSDQRRLSDVARERYSERDVLDDMRQVNSVIMRLFGEITLAWPLGVETLTISGIAAHRLIGRTVVGGGAEPHDDNVSKEIPEEPQAASVQVQIGTNIYVEVPDEGGELQGWRKQLSKEEYEEMRLRDAERSYGIDRKRIGERQWEIKPERGDVIMFRNSELHAIRPAKGQRTTWGFFLGYRGDDEPLLVWS